ncbi:UNVERIFIED_CONTAM: Auxin-responsive protein SAUR36 [Sesamum radiatum]|uniref:Auxin-responsive protein SAUR36 n=1 Tax=Sesamum radiatum TaxID=300843 RepID=A0AAW2VHT8_SESRA
MGRIRGFLLKHRVTTLFRRVFRRPSAFHRLDPPQGARVKPLSGLIRWTDRLRTKAKAILCRNLDPGRGYIRAGQEPVLEKPASVPKGHMAVYVGQKDGDFQRILVPVVYFNHPLFGDLLKESEKEYGFNHSGGITIPCRISEFERVQTRIKAVQCNRKLLSWKRNRRSLIVS